MQLFLVIIGFIFCFTCVELILSDTYSFLPRAIIKITLLLWKCDDILLLLIKNLLNFMERRAKSSSLKSSSSSLWDVFRNKSFFFSFSSLLELITPWVLRQPISWSSLSLVRPSTLTIKILFAQFLGRDRRCLVTNSTFEMFLSKALRSFIMSVKWINTLN